MGTILILENQELSLGNSASISEAGLLAIQNGAEEIDMNFLQTVDSSAVAVMLSWQRYANKLNQPLRFSGVPSSLQSLIALYGMAHFFHLGEASKNN